MQTPVASRENSIVQINYANAVQSASSVNNNKNDSSPHHMFTGMLNSAHSFTDALSGWYKPTHCR